MAKNNKNQSGAVLERKPVKRAPSAVRVSFPTDGETVTHPSYTFQIEAPAGACGVDICVDQGEWLSCREAVGLWWFDWSGYDSGEHEVVARLRRQDGSMESSEERVFMVK